MGNPKQSFSESCVSSAPRGSPRTASWSACGWLLGPFYSYFGQDIFSFLLKKISHSYISYSSNIQVLASCRPPRPKAPLCDSRGDRFIWQAPPQVKADSTSLWSWSLSRFWNTHIPRIWGYEYMAKSQGFFSFKY